MEDNNTPPLLSVSGGLKGRLWNALLHAQRAILFVASLAIATGIFAVVCMRYILKTDIYGFEELLMIPAFWLYFMGAAYGAYEGSHITAEIVSVYVKDEKLKSVLEATSSLITVCLSALVTYWAVDMVQFALAWNPRTPVFRISMAIPQSSILAGFFLMTVYFTGHLILRVRKLVRVFRGGQADGAAAKAGVNG